MSKTFFTIIIALLLGLSLFAQEEAPQETAAEEQEAQTNLWQPDIMQDGRFIQIGEYSIENPYKQRSSKLLDGKNRNQLWRFFMHGVTDLRGYPIPWQALDATPPTIPLDDKSIINVPYKKSDLPAVTLVESKSIRFPKPMIAGDVLAASHGEIIRVFIWIKGEDTGRNADLYTGSPSITLTLVDGTGTEVAIAEPLFKTRGTFPWFCYHLDVKVPFNFTAAQPQATSTEENAEGAETAAENSEGEQTEEGTGGNSDDDAAIRALAQQLIGIQEKGDEDEVHQTAPGLYVTLKNPTSGIAWFSTLSWQKIKATEAILSPSAKATSIDPVTGSYAPNPDHDELPMHLLFGLAPNAPWGFLKGTSALKPLISIDNLKECLEEGKNDWLFMLHVLPYLYSLYNNGMLLKTMTEFEEGWDIALLEYIQSAQNPSTGLWEVNGVPNLFVTEAILKNTFSAQPPPYKDWTPEPTPWREIRNSSSHTRMPSSTPSSRPRRAATSDRPPGTTAPSTPTWPTLLPARASATFQPPPPPPTSCAMPSPMAHPRRAPPRRTWPSPRHGTSSCPSCL